MTRPIAGAPPPLPIPLKERASIVFVGKGHLDVLDGAFVLVVAWDAPTDAGFTFETFGKNRRIGVDFDGLRLVAFHPQESS